MVMFLSYAVLYVFSCSSSCVSLGLVLCRDVLSMCASVCFAGECCLYVSAMVHCHHEPAGDLAHRTHGSAAPRLPAQDPHQDYKGETASTWQVGRMSTSHCVSVALTHLCPAAEKVPGLPPAGRPRLHPEQQDVRHGAQQADRGGGHRFGEGRRHAGHLHERQRRGG